MYLYEAIEHAREKAKELRERAKVMEDYIGAGQDIIASAQESIDCECCADEHEQLAEWLEDYRRLSSLMYHEESYFIGSDYRITYVEYHEPGEDAYTSIKIYKAKNKHVKGGEWFEDENWVFEHQEQVKPMSADEVLDWGSAYVKNAREIDRKNSKLKEVIKNHYDDEGVT